MVRSVLFVHGTGVRAESFKDTVDVLSEVFLERFRGVDLRSCYWGDAEGARPASEVSVPGYAASGGGAADPEDEQLALWGVLYTDPWRELRLLGLQKTSQTRSSPRAEPAEQVFVREIGRWEPSPALRELLAGYRLSTAFDEALAQVRASAELRAAARTAEIDAHAHRYVVARALVAHAIAGLGEAPAPTGAGRNVLLEAVARDLDAVRKQVPGWVQNLGTLYLQARRGRYTDSATRMLGDILRYQARGEGLRDLIRESVADVPGDGPVTLLGHSLGGIACVDLLAMDPPDRVDRLVTVGSQAGYFYEIGALCCAEPPAALPEHFPRQWLNVHDPRDVLSYPAGVFGSWVTDVEVANGEPFPTSHSAYWTNPSVWEAATSWIG